jgi:hypothetical protein
MNIEAASALVIVGPNWSLGCLLERAFPAAHALPGFVREAIELLDARNCKGRKICPGS